MNLYVDLSLLGHLLLVLLASNYLTIFTNSFTKKYFLFLFHLFSFIPLFFPSSLGIYLITITIFILPFIFIKTKNVVKSIIVFSGSYYFFAITLSGFIDGITIYNGIIAINRYDRVLFLLIAPFTYLLCVILTKIIINYQKILFLVYDITINLENKTIKTKGYLDTGNTLKVDSKPVIFLVDKYQFKLNSQSINFDYLSGESWNNSSGYHGSVKIKKGRKSFKKEVIVSFINRNNFHGYDCLINLWALK